MPKKFLLRVVETTTTLLLNSHSPWWHSARRIHRTISRNDTVRCRLAIKTLLTSCARRLLSISAMHVCFLQIWKALNWFWLDLHWAGLWDLLNIIVYIPSRYLSRRRSSDQKMWEGRKERALALFKIYTLLNLLEIHKICMERKCSI